MQGLRVGFPLPEDIRKEIIVFFLDLYELETLEFPRSLWPEAEVEGDPWLVIFSDGSIKGFGAVVYIRWKLAEGGWW